MIVFFREKWLWLFPASDYDDTQKSHIWRHKTHKSTGSSHKTMSKSFSCDSQSKGSVPTPRGSMKVGLRKLEMAALWRYWRHFNLVDAILNPSKEELVDVVQSHLIISCHRQLVTTFVIPSSVAFHFRNTIGQHAIDLKNSL
ncbi:hypothetical protein PTKIN_Ptkin14bG0187900 [Pterospermum kingtungense]